MRRSLVALIAATILLVLTPLSFSATIEDEQWPIPNDFEPGHHSVLIEDPVTGFSHSQLTGNLERNEYLCSSLEDPSCSKATTFSYNVILPVCTRSEQLDCIRSIEAIHPDGRVDAASFRRYTHTNHPNAFRGTPSRGVPDPEMPSIWEFNSTSHTFGNQFAIAVGMNGYIGKSDGWAKQQDFFMNLHPVSVKQGNGGASDVNGYENYSKCMQFVETETSRSYIGCGTGAEEFGNYRCAFKLGENGGCLLRHAFPNGVTFRVTVDLTTEPNGWFHGRMKDPEISVTPLNPRGVRLSVKGESTKQPVFYWGESFSSMTPEQQRIWNDCVPRFSCYSATRIPWSYPERESDGNKRNVQFTPRPTGEPLIEFMSKFLGAVGDKATVIPSAWNIRALSTEEMVKAEGCFTQGSGVKGVVTTNATVYSEGPPVFDGSTLQYRVSSPHYTPAGEEFRGTYNLVMKSSVARCLYGFSTAPITASIEVFGEGGEKSVATTAVGERDGWLYLAAHNFTFSAPVIKASISQERESTASKPSPTVKESRSVRQKQAITCSKGTKTRKVSDVKPKCPKGWKKV